MTKEKTNKRNNVVFALGIISLFGVLVFCAYSFGLLDGLFAKPPAEVPVVEAPVEEVPVFATALNAAEGNIFEVAIGTEAVFVFTTDGAAHVSADYNVTVADEAIATVVYNGEQANTQDVVCGVVKITGVAVGDTQMSVTRADGKATLEVTVRVYDPSYTLDANGTPVFTTEPLQTEFGLAVGQRPDLRQVPNPAAQWDILMVLTTEPQTPEFPSVNNNQTNLTLYLHCAIM